MKQIFAIATLILAIAMVGSFQVNARAEDVGTLYAVGERLFAETEPSIPGYNAPYPLRAASQAATEALILSEAASSTLYGASGSFAASAPSIPGYNAKYPELFVVVVQD